MGSEEGFLKNLAIWSYSRGTLQYDIICILILAFIFFVPPSCFVRGENSAMMQTNLHNSPSLGLTVNANPVAQQALRNQANLKTNK
jgi:hypothetical protein